MKKLLALILALLTILCVFASCNDETNTESSSSSSSEKQTSEESSSSSKSEESTKPVEDDKNKYPEVSKIDYSINVNQTINANIFTNLNEFKNEGEALNYSNARPIEVSGITNITTPGVYRLYGTTTKGHVKVDIERIDETAPLEKVILVFDNVNITSYPDASSIPPIYSKGCDLTIILPKGTTSTITDTKTNIEKSAIYVKTGNLTIEGEGKLVVKAVHKNAIFNTKTLTINGGVFDLTSEYSAIYAKTELVINSGEFKLESGKSGLKVGEFETTNLPEENVLGKMTLNGGKYEINSVGNAIDAYGTVNVNGGGYVIDAGKDGINATEQIIFGGDETNTIMIIESEEDGIKIKTPTDTEATVAEESTEIVPDVKITGKTNIKILSDRDAIDAKDIEIDMNGILYIKTNAKFVEDMSDGEYIIDNKEYHKVDRTLYDGKTFYAISGSSKGITAKNTISIKNGQIAIDSDEEAIVTSDGKNGDSKTINTISISGGTLFIDTRESAIKADNSITVSGSSKINIIKADKGLNAKKVIVENGIINIVAVTDAIDADSTTVNNGTLYLFDKVDYPSEGGEFIVNAGTVISVSTTKSPKTPTSATGKVLAKAIEAPTDYKFGNYINIKGDSIDVVLKLPKNYTEKLSVVVVAPSISTGNYTISAGLFSDGSVSNLVCSGGTFTAISSESASVE